MLKLRVRSSSVRSSSASSLTKPVASVLPDLLRPFDGAVVIESRFFRSVLRQV